MPGMNLPASDYLATKLNDLEQRLRALETQQSFVVTDASGRIRTRLGLLGNGDFGFTVTDPAGVTREVFPISAASSGSTFSTSSTSFVSLTGSPEVTAYIGESGDALVTVSATITTASITSAQIVGGRIGLSVDGATPVGNWMEAGYNGGSYPTALPETTWACSSSQLLSQSVGKVSAGEHSFGLVYADLGGGASAFFDEVAIVVQPI